MATIPEQAAAQSTSRDFSVLQQTLDIEIDFANQSLKGVTEITILPFSKELRQIPLNCRQCNIKSLTIEGKPARFDYHDPYRKIKPHSTWNAEQYHLYKDRFEPQFGDVPQEELTIKFPKSVAVQESSAFVAQQDGFFAKAPKRSGATSAPLETPPPSSTTEVSATYLQMVVRIGFEVRHIRDGLHFVGMAGNDQRYPHAYTTKSSFAGHACTLFPCVDDPAVRCHWNITLTCAKTLGDALKIPLPSGESESASGKEEDEDGDPYLSNIYGLTEEERAYEMIIACSGTLMDETGAFADPTRKRSTFVCDSSVSANQIGFAVGPFMKVDISAEFREADDDDKVGDEALAITALCLPGRSEEVRNTALPMARAADYFSSTFVTHAFPVYQICFVDDLDSDTVVAAALSLCSSRLLFPADVIDPMYEVTRKLVHSLAVQYSGIGVAPREPSDIWCVEGMAQFMTDLFMKQLCGNNEYRYQQKLGADKVFDLDHNRPPIYGLGPILHLDSSLSEFLALKANVVLFILDRRLAKSSGTTGMAKIIMRTLSNAKSSFDAEGTLLSTAQFQRTCEKIGHCKLETFFYQWVYGAGCPQFVISQRFNKKKLVVEMQIQQVQSDPERQFKRSKKLDPCKFIRDVNEESNEVYAGSVQTVFTGPMTIRIHEADGTPYEHIVDIKEQNTKMEIPYNTKYKRLKRSRRQKERAAANAGVDVSAEPQDDTLLYCLGDVLEAEEEVAEWRLIDWPKEEEDKMSQESYEWIRMDADFEWICKMQIGMPAYMYVSQLQQDRDVVAQYDSLQWIASQRPHPLISTFLTRTIMDKRYFHGIRTAAIAILPRCAREELQWIGHFHLQKVFAELFCNGDDTAAHPNDFSDRAAYLVQCEIPKAMARIRDNSGLVPMKAKRFFLDKLKFNDNSINQFSDHYYVAGLMSCLADALIPLPDFERSSLSLDEQDEEDQFRREAIGEIERYRRIDEWISSYQNVYSVTALDCLLKLAKAQLIQPKLADFLRYTHHGNADTVRLQALRCLTDLGGLRSAPVMRYFLRSMGTDVSPYMRAQIFAVFGRGLGLVAMDEDKREEKRPEDSGLIIEEEGARQRQAEIARQQTVPGAMAALRTELGNNPALLEGLWSAINSPVASLQDIWRLLGLCELVVEPKNAMIAVLRLPRWWRCVHEGDGKIRFYQTERIRRQPSKPMDWAPSKPSQAPATSADGRPFHPPPPSRKVSVKLNLSRAPSSQEVPSATPVADIPGGPLFPLPRDTPGPMQPPTAPDTPKVFTPAAAPQSKREPALPASEAKFKSAPKPRKSKVVVLKSAKLRDPHYHSYLTSIIPKPSLGPKTNGAGEARSASAAGVTLKLNVGSAAGAFRVPTSPALKTEPSSPGPLEATSGLTSPAQQRRRRQSSVASTSTVNSRVGQKRKSETPVGNAHPSVEDTSPALNGAGDGGSKRRKSGTPSSRRSESATPAHSSPANGLTVPSNGASNSKKRKSDVSIDADDSGFANGDQSHAKKRKGATPASAKPKKSLVLKLKLDGRRLGDRIADLENGDSTSGNARVADRDGSDSPDIPLAAAAQMHPAAKLTSEANEPVYGPIGGVQYGAHQAAPSYGPITSAPATEPSSTDAQTAVSSTTAPPANGDFASQG